MANLNTMYPGVANSPDTYLREPLASGGSILYVVEGLVFGTLPTLAVIGDDHTAETVLITAKRADNGYDITRAIEGNAKDWIKGTTVARNFTNKDYKALVDNINVLNTTKAELIDGKVNPAQLPVDKDTTYTAGTNVTITGTTISAKDTIYDDTALETRITAVENREDKDTTYDVATTTTNGLMSSADKAKLNGVETGAQKNTITSVQGRTGAVTISKSDVGLGSVNNVAITAAQVTKLNELNYTRAMTQATYDSLSEAEKDRLDVWYGIYEG